MENKLIKVDNEYYLVKEQIVLEGEYGVSFSQGINGYGRGYHVFLNDGKPASKLTSICDGVCKILYSTKELNNVGKLSKENCDEIFKTFSIEEISVDRASHFGGVYRNPEGFSDEQIGYLHGFIEGAELNKDKLFTINDIDKAIEWATVNGRKGDITHYDIDNFIQSLQQPREIEVEIKMICPHPSDTYRCGLEFGCDEDGCNNPIQIPFTDSNGCIFIIKK